MEDLKRKLNYSRGLLNELKMYEKEQKVTLNVYDKKKSRTQQYKKKLLNDQQKQVNLVFHFNCILILNIFTTN